MATHEGNLWLELAAQTKIRSGARRSPRLQKQSRREEISMPPFNSIICFRAQTAMWVCFSGPVESPGVYFSPELCLSVGVAAAHVTTNCICTTTGTSSSALETSQVSQVKSWAENRKRHPNVRAVTVEQGSVSASDTMTTTRRHFLPQHGAARTLERFFHLITWKMDTIVAYTPVLVLYTWFPRWPCGTFGN